MSVKRIFCIGKQENFDRFISEPHDSDCDFVYFGEEPNDGIQEGGGILLLECDLKNIAYFVRDNTPNVSFLHNGRILSENDPGEMNRFQDEYLRTGDFDCLKDLNAIRMFFDISEKKTQMSAYPLHIQLETTTFCNAHCIMCDHFIAHNRGSAHLTVESIDKLASVLPFASMVIMHGNGEPLINPQIISIFEKYRKYHIQVSLNTNLSYLSDEILFCLNQSCSSLHVSCDGTDEKQYESIRLGLSYSKFIENVRKLSRLDESIDRVLEVVLMRQNMKETVKFVRFAHEYGFSKVIFNPLGCNEWIGNSGDGIREYETTAYQNCLKAQEEGARLGVFVVTPFDGVDLHSIRPDIKVVSDTYSYCSEEDSRRLFEMYPWYTNTIAVRDLEPKSLLPVRSCSISGVCEYPFGKTYIDLEGRVSACCPASRRIIDMISEEKPFVEIWNCKKYMDLRKCFYDGTIPNLCMDCFLMKNDSLVFMSKPRV